MFTQNKKSKFLMYHAFSETHFGRYCMNINQFKNHKINNDYIVTFDDGSESLYRYRDIISTKGQSQILFIRTDKINNKNYLTSTQIQSLLQTRLATIFPGADVVVQVGIRRCRNRQGLLRVLKTSDQFVDRFMGS